MHAGPSDTCNVAPAAPFILHPRAQTKAQCEEGEMEGEIRQREESPLLASSAEHEQEEEDEEEEWQWHRWGWKVGRVASVAAGVQFGWALQLSMLTPYVEELGIRHEYASVIWLCGPLSGMVVGPLVGYASDRCRSSWGRRRPFMLLACLGIALAQLLIAFSADIGHAFGDPLPSSSFARTRARAVAAFVLGFWILDLANNLQQGPSRALLADLSGKRDQWMRYANGFFAFFMALGNILGYATGSYSRWYDIFPFTRTEACQITCANLKSAFLISIIILIITTLISVTATSEKTLSQLEAEANASRDGLELKNISCNNTKEEESLWNFLRAFKNLPPGMWDLLLVTALTWIAWFPFTLFDTDWMGREIYGGMPSGSAYIVSLYQDGVRAGAFGLMLNAVVLGITSLLIAYLSQKLGPHLLWALANFILCISLACMVIITYMARSYHEHLLTPPLEFKVIALTLFAVLGAPLGVTYSLPFAIAGGFSSQSETGQGVSMGVLNLAVVIPQLIVSLGSGPLDQLLGNGSNVPAFTVAAISAFLAGIGALVLLRSPHS